MPSVAERCTFWERSNDDPVERTPQLIFAVPCADRLELAAVTGIDMSMSCVWLGGAEIGIVAARIVKAPRKIRAAGGVVVRTVRIEALAGIAQSPDTFGVV